MCLFVVRQKAPGYDNNLHNRLKGLRHCPVRVRCFVATTLSADRLLCSRAASIEPNHSHEGRRKIKNEKCVLTLCGAQKFLTLLVSVKK